MIEDKSSSPDGTRYALWFCFGLACMSLVANCIVWAYMRSTGRGMASNDSAEIAKHIRSYSKAITPEPPTKLAAMRMPPALIPAMLAIQAFYYPPFSFTAFTNDLFPDRFGTSKSQANILSGSTLYFLIACSLVYMYIAHSTLKPCLQNVTAIFVLCTCMK